MRQKLSQLRIKYLPKNNFPKDDILIQLRRLHLRDGFIFDSYQACVAKSIEPYKHEDIIYSCVDDFWAFYVYDIAKPEKLLGWCLVVMGHSNTLDSSSICIQMYSNKKYRNMGIGTLMFRKCVNIAKRNNIPYILVYESDSNKKFFNKMRELHKGISILEVYDNT